jgi:hypothetical protein
MPGTQLFASAIFFDAIPDFASLVDENVDGSMIKSEVIS